MENSTIEGFFFFGKIGVDNLLLMLVGALCLLIYVLASDEASRYHKHIILAAAFFFSTWGFFLDAFRYKFLRRYLLFGGNFQLYKTVCLVVTLLPLYLTLFEYLTHLLSARYKRRKTRHL